MKVLKYENRHEILTVVIALVWVINGFICKVLNFAPRHQEIVGEILNEEYALVLTRLIGFGEMLIAIWILSQYKSKFATIFQVVIILTMNIIEFIKVPDLLLHGKMNLVFAFLFSFFLLLNEFYLKHKTIQKA